MRRYRIAAIPADGIGPEVIGAGLEVLDALATRAGFALDVDHYDWGSAFYRRTGTMMPADGLAQLRGADAIYFGAVGAPDIPDHITLWGLRLAICQGFDQYANLRPTRILAGTHGPLRDVPARRHRLDDRAREQRGRIRGCRRARASRIAGRGGDRGRGVHPRRRHAHPALRLRPGARAAAAASHRGHEIQRAALRDGAVGRGGGRGREGFSRRDLGQGAGRCDDGAHGAPPGDLDTIVATNLHADILSDLAAALAGSIGIAPTANVDPERRFPSMFEPIHGSAFDITGKGIANPVGAFWTAAMMLEHLGENRGGHRADGSGGAGVRGRDRHPGPRRAFKYRRGDAGGVQRDRGRQRRYMRARRVPRRMGRGHIARGAGRLCIDLGGRVRAADRQRSGRAHPPQGRPAARHARRQRQFHLLRRRRRDDPVLAHAADERGRHPHRLARDPGPARFLQHHEEDAQRLAGRRDQPQPDQARDL